jgi:SAM-dependent MidA family methyltransferase
LQSYFDRLGIVLPDDYETEVNLAMAGWLREAGQALQKGLVVLIDYGRPAHEYYAPERTGGTLRAFRNHRVSSNVLEASGMDLTADVDFTSLALDARAAGFIPLAFMEMGTFLMMGVEGIVRAGTRPAPSGLRYLLHPEGMGGAFHVLILGKGIDPAEWTFEHNRLRRLGLPE